MNAGALKEALDKFVGEFGEDAKIKIWEGDEDGDYGIFFVLPKTPEGYLGPYLFLGNAELHTE